MGANHKFKGKFGAKMKEKLNCFFTTNESAMLYECGFSCDNAIYFSANSEAFFITDSRYALEAKEKATKNTQIIESDDLIKDFIKLAKNTKNIIYDNAQISVEFFEKIKSLSLKGKPNFHQIKRIIKSDDEVALIAKSQKLNKKAFKRFAKFVAKNGTCKNGDLSEKNLHFIARQCLENNGALDLSFNPIVALNENAAKPHALPCKKALQKGDLLLFDAGVKYKNYCSDMTRTAYFGRDSREVKAFNFDKSQKFPPKIQKIYDIVLKAQERAIKGAKSGMKAKEIDFLARDFIDKKGFSKFFAHSLGHGVGLDIHELPRISRKSDEIIEDGMVFSIEPGIYLQGEFGIRIEDLVVMKNGKAEVL